MDIKHMLQPEKRWAPYIVPQTIPPGKLKPLPKYIQHQQNQLQKESVIENSSSFLRDSIGDNEDF